ncbi:integrase catalytic domain-containing protein [Trichonephila clavipes]|nr:integrase catalytic domain-containing protein [Trichonephila clavipes]
MIVYHVILTVRKKEGKAITKRSLLSTANHIFDPIGFTAPVTLKPKLILQEIWKLKLKWDENLPEVILNQVKKWLEQLLILAGIKIPRCFNLRSNGIKRITLHVFCDARKKEYAACVFLRVEYEENVFVKLVQAKARVAPLKDISILRMELLVFTIGARLAASVKNDLNLPGVDLADPLHLKDKRKGWVVLFTCAVFRAMHFELITSLSTAAFLQSLRRFILQRDRPTIIYSDNGTNFVGSNSALKSIDWDVVMSKSNIQKIKWRFNPPNAAWWGGFGERMVQMLKQILRKMLGRASLYYEELNSALCKCEQVINSRLLTYISEDVNDLSPLTLAMFLQEIEPSDVTDIDCLDHQEINKRIRHVQNHSGTA